MVGVEPVGRVCGGGIQLGLGRPWLRMCGQNRECDEKHGRQHSTREVHWMSPVVSGTWNLHIDGRDHNLALSRRAQLECHTQNQIFRRTFAVGMTRPLLNVRSPAIHFRLPSDLVEHRGNGTATSPPGADVNFLADRWVSTGQTARMIGSYIGQRLSSMASMSVDGQFSRRCAINHKLGLTRGPNKWD